MLTWHLFVKLLVSARAGSLVRKISFLSFFSTALSVFSFLIVLFVMSGMNKSTRERIMSLDPHLVIQVYKPEISESLRKSDIMRGLELSDSAQIRNYERQDIILRTGEGQVRGVLARGLTDESLQDFMKALRKTRTLPNISLETSLETDQFELKDDEILMGSDLARSLGLFDGDYVSFVSPEALLLPSGTLPQIEKMRVSQIVTTTLPDVDSQVVFYLQGGRLSRLTQISKPEQGYEIFLKDGERADRVKSRFPISDDYKVETWMDRNSSLFFALRIEKFNIGLILTLAGLIAGSSVLTVLSLLLSSKKRDVALLRTLGLSESQTESVFVKMGMLLSLSGVFVGVFFGALAGLYIQENPLKVLPDIYYDSEIPAQVDFVLIAIVLIASVLLSYLGSKIPARMTRQLTPVTLLKAKH